MPKWIKKKERKPRTKPQKDAYLMRHCSYDDDTKCKECGHPWSCKCDGDIHKCMKLKMHHLASLSSEKRKKYLDKELEWTRVSDKIHREYLEMKELERL